MTTPAYTDALAAVTERLCADALAHSKSTAETAARIAETYCVNGEHARLAGLLHDWARENGGDALLAEARSLGIVVTEVDEAVPYLLHARIGAEGVRAAFPGIPEEIAGAIERHTVGGANMSPLDKVVYVADMLEPGRCFHGVDDLRDLIGVATLDELFAEAYVISMHHLVRGRKRIHPATIDAWNAIIARGHR